MRECLIIVDFQNDFVTGSLGFLDANQIEAPILKKLKHAKANNIDIIFTLDTHDKNYLETSEGINLPTIHCIKDTFGHEVYGDAKKYLKNAKVFEKNSFGSLELGNYLKEKSYEKIEISGLVTNMCVISTAIIAKAALEEAEIIIDSNAVKSFNDDLHTKALEVLQGMYFKVI